MKYQAHPIEVVNVLKEKYPTALLSFVLYSYEYKEGITGKETFRHEFLEAIDNVNEDWFASKTQDPTKDLGLSYRVLVNGAPFYIPMLDFATSDSGALTKALGEQAWIFPHSCDFELFESGRSFHGYIAELWELEKVQRFWGAALLLNPSKGDTIVDHRWIGHSIRRNTAALRWSANQGHYKKIPQHIFTMKIFS